MANPRTIARIEARILERAAHCLQFEVNDPRASFITLTQVKLSSDLSFAKIYYSVLGASADRSKVAHMLDHAGGFIQRQVARVLDLRRVPRLSFVYDDSAEAASDLQKLIKEARERDKLINPHLEDGPVAADGATTNEPGDAEDAADEEFGEPGDLDADGLDADAESDDDEFAQGDESPGGNGPARAR